MVDAPPHFADSITAWVGEGKSRPHIDRVLPLEQSMVLDLSSIPAVVHHRRGRDDAPHAPDARQAAQGRRPVNLCVDRFHLRIRRTNSICNFVGGISWHLGIAGSIKSWRRFFTRRPSQRATMKEDPRYPAGNLAARLHGGHAPKFCGQNLTQFQSVIHRAGISFVRCGGVTNVSHR